MKSWPEFQRFIKFQNIGDDLIKQSAGLFNHIHYKRGSYIYKEKDAPDYFYCILKGTVSIRKHVVSKHNPNNNHFVKELKDLKQNSIFLIKIIT